MMNIKYFKASLGVRYWEDTDVNGEPDIKGDKIPLRSGDDWDITIDVETGIILDWVIGTKADVHYKVCDAGLYSLLDENKKEVYGFDGYVPNCLALKDEDFGFGDYVIMDIDENGKIKHWDKKFIDNLVLEQERNNIKVG